MNQIDPYRIGYYRLHTKALCRAIHPETLKVFHKYEPIEVTSTVLVCLAKDKEHVKLIAESLLRLQYHRVLQTHMKEDVSLKRKIGGVHYKVEILDFVLKIYKDTIFYSWEV